MESFSRYLQSLPLPRQREQISVKRMEIEELDPADFQQIIDLRSEEDFEEDNIPTSRNIPVLTRKDEVEIVDRRAGESRIISIVW